MSFSDADLYTGVDANKMFENEKPSEVQESAVDDQQNIIAALMPNVDYILEKLKTHRELSKDIDTYVAQLGDNPSEGQIKDEYRARVLFRKMIDELESDILNQLGTAKEAAND